MASNPGYLLNFFLLQVAFTIFPDFVLKLCSENDVPVFFEPTDPRKGSKALKSPWTKGGLISKKF
jgi:hypothetical protein